MTHSVYFFIGISASFLLPLFGGGNLLSIWRKFATKTYPISNCLSDKRRILRQSVRVTERMILYGIDEVPGMREDDF